jgi:hypothetical protein
MGVPANVFLDSYTPSPYHWKNFSMIIKPKPRAFIGSSKEGRKHAVALQALLSEKMEVTVWEQGVFDPSSYTMDALIEEAHRSAFAIIIFTPDDEVSIRGQQSFAARDNVIFELGLFVGILGRKRVFTVAPDDVRPFRIPTDLLGLSLATYKQRTDGNFKAALGPASEDIISAAARVVANDPEPGCAYMHTEDSSHVIPIDGNRFSVVFQPPMRCNPSLNFKDDDGKSMKPRHIDYWTRYGFTVTLDSSANVKKLRFTADAGPSEM